MKKILIDIDLIRDWYSSLILTYVKQVDDFNGDLTDVEPADLWKHFKFPKYIEKFEDLVDTDEDGNVYTVTETSLEIDESSEFELNETYFNEFLTTNVLEIFGHARERENNLIHYLNGQDKKDNVQVAIFCTNKGKAKPATLFYLSKYGCEINSIYFVNNVEDVPLYDSYTHVFVGKNSLSGNLKLKELDFTNL